jgi:hypothetical protein
MADQSYNPLDKLHLGESVARALLAQPVVALPPPTSFVGAGIYALYYTGNFSAYRKIAEKNVNDAWNLPIYVGKAVPLGARRGGYGLGESPGDVLYRRLREHAMSMQQVADLALEDFRCRYLVRGRYLDSSRRIAAYFHVRASLESPARWLWQPRPRGGPLQSTTLSLGRGPSRAPMGCEA